MAAADTTLKVNVDTSDATRSLAALQGKFNDLKTAILGAGFIAAIQQANDYANAVKDISVATDISITTVYGLGKAFAVNGGSAEGAQNAILKFTQAVGAALQGSDEAAKAFDKAGVSLADLRKLTQEEAFAKYTAGLARMGSTAERTASQVAILGKGSKGVDFGGGVQGSMAGGVSAGTVSAIQAGADASEAMKRNFASLTEALLRVVEPLNRIAAASEVTVSVFEKLIKALLAVGAAFLIFTRVLPAIQTLGNSLAAVGGIVTWFGAQFAALGGHLVRAWANFLRFAGVLASGYSAIQSFGFAILAVLKFFARFAGIVGIIYSVVQAVDALIEAFTGFSIIDWTIKKFGELYDAARAFFNLKPSGETAKENARELDLLKRRQDAVIALRKAEEESAAKLAEFQEQQKKLRTELEKVGDAYQKTNAATLQKIAVDTILVGKGDDEKEMLQAQVDLYSNLRDTIAGLIEKRKEWAQGPKLQQESVNLIDEEIARVRELGAAQAEALPKYITSLQTAKTLEEDRKRSIENLTRAMEQQTQRASALADANLAIIARQQEVGFAGAQQTRSPFQQQMESIREDAKKAALEAGRAFAAAFEDTGDGMTTARAQELADGLNAIAAGYQNIVDAQILNLEQSRTWSEGWKTAFNEYADNASNSAKTAQSMFGTATKGMEDALVNFAKTGKFEFKGLLNTIVEELLRSQIRQLLASTFGGNSSGGGGGFFSSLFAGLGDFFKASGGPVAAGQSYIVGEKGPELFTAGSAGMITPNGGQGASGAMSVTYNINAVDAESFRSLVARDPEFLYAVTEQGRRRLPSARR
jgi:lambda family phage tail tape measure protein